MPNSLRRDFGGTRRRRTACVFNDADALADHCYHLLNGGEAQPCTTMSVGLRDRAHRY